MLSECGNMIVYKIDTVYHFKVYIRSVVLLLFNCVI